MFSLFIILLNFSKSLACDRTKSLFLNDEPCMVRPTLIDINPNELKYYPFMPSLNKSNGSFNVLSPKTCVPNEIKDIYVKAFNMITNKDEAKAMTEHILCDCKWKFNSKACNSNQNGIIKHVNVNAKTIVSLKRIIVGILAHVSTKKANTIATNVMSTALINGHSKNLRVCYILHTVLLAIILLLLNIIICCYYAEQKGTI